MQCDEETFCESISVVEHDMESPRNLKIKTEKSGSMLNKQLKMSNSYVPTPLELRKVSTNDDSVIALENETNEVINVEESQPTQALYQYVLDIKQELPENESQDFVEESPLQKKSPSSSHNVVTMPRTVECEDCAKVKTQSFEVTFKNTNIFCFFFFAIPFNSITTCWDAIWIKIPPRNMVYVQNIIEMSSFVQLHLDFGIQR